MFQGKGRSWKTLLIVMAAVLTVSVLAGCGKKGDNAGNNSASEAGDTSKVIATYDGGEITENEFDLEQRIVLALQPQMEQFLQMDDFRDYLVKQVITYEYLELKADDTAKETGKKKAEEQFAAMKESMGAEQFKSMLDAQTLTEDQFKNYMVKIYTVMQSEQAKVTDEDVAKEFDATKEDYITASVRHILIGLTDKEGKERTSEDALKLANEVKAKLDAGEDFATLVKEYSSDGETNINNGGLYPDTPISNWVTEFKDKAATLPLNTISEPVQTTYGYHIMRVEARTEKTLADLTDDEKDLIKMSLASQKLDEFMSGELEEKVIKSIDLPKVETTEEGADSGTESDGNAGTGTDAGTDTNAGTDSGNAGTEGTDAGTNSK